MIKLGKSFRNFGACRFSFTQKSQKEKKKYIYILSKASFLLASHALGSVLILVRLSQLEKVYKGEKDLYCVMIMIKM